MKNVWMKTIGLMMLASSASALSIAEPECDVDADCAEGQICEVVFFGACPPCLDDDEECRPCMDEAYGYCTEPPAPPCESDADCNGNEVCVSFVYESCDTVDFSCADDEPCIGPAPEECGEITESLCLPPHDAPCQVDADCGDGFLCQTLEVCGCSGGDQDPDGLSQPCVCEPVGEGYCELIHVECIDNSDCSDGFVCHVYDVVVEPAIGMGLSEIHNGFCGPTDQPIDLTPQGEPGKERINWEGGKNESSGGCSAMKSENPAGFLALIGLGLFGLRRRR